MALFAAPEREQRFTHVLLTRAAQLSVVAVRVEQQIVEGILVFRKNHGAEVALSL